MRSVSALSSYMADRLQIEVVYALPERQLLVALSVVDGTSARAAVELSGIADQFPGLNAAQCPLGLFGRRLKDAEDYRVKEGDRVEIYRPLQMDPKEIRKRRASMKKAQSK